MRAALFAGAMTLGLAVASPSAHAIGCLTGGAAGALAGHMMGHGMLGAVGGCVAGRHYHNQQMRREDFQDQRTYEQRRRSDDRDYRSPWDR